MNTYFVAAAALIFVIGLIHSVLGERLVFRKMRVRGIVPTNGGQVLRESNVRILWASWHMVTVTGWCLALALWWLADPVHADLARSGLSMAITGALAGSAALVLIGTRGRHPGWAGLLAAASLALAGMVA
jgi:hypothetical protein